MWQERGYVNDDGRQALKELVQELDCRWDHLSLQQATKEVGVEVPIQFR